VLRAIALMMVAARTAFAYTGHFKNYVSKHSVKSGLVLCVNVSNNYDHVFSA
jgi:hypothetical protein